MTKTCAITEQALKSDGFDVRSLGDGYDVWARDGVEIWDFNGEYWIVQALDQAGIHVEFRTVEHLNDFLSACRLRKMTPVLDKTEQPTKENV